MKLKLWGYGAIEPDGSAYMEESCVAEDRGTVEYEIVEQENDSRPPDLNLRVVALYYKQE